MKVVFGAASFGYDPAPGMPSSSDTSVLQSILDVFKKHGHNELDTARIYGSGTSEKILADVNYAAQGLVVDTKVRSFVPGAHAPEKIHESVAESLRELKTKKVHILYLHSPDRATPFEATLAAINEEYKKGHFEELGLSNYPPDEVEQIVKITKDKGYVQPTVYQGLYNLLVRGGEETLFPVLRKHGIRFYAYSPLAGSFLTGIVSQQTDTAPRFDETTMGGKMYKARFFKQSHFDAIEKIQAVAKKHSLAVPEVALRWLAHHSHLKNAKNDAVIIGGKTLAKREKLVRLFGQSGAA